jgi:acetyl-CoA carboxylase biotin carboxylase subunit
VTELVTGIDLVREQIQVANGARLSFRQEDIDWTGHAIECRVYAEDPENNFLPSPGRIKALSVPAGPGIRDDSGVESGADVSIYYDPMLSKLAAWGRTREEAIDRLRRALDEYHVSGIKTTLPFFRQIVRDQEFVEGRLDTGFIERFQERILELAATSPPEDETAIDVAAIAAAIAYAERTKQKTVAASSKNETSSKWKNAGRQMALR